MATTPSAIRALVSHPSTARPAARQQAAFAVLTETPASNPKGYAVFFRDVVARKLPLTALAPPDPVQQMHVITGGMPVGVIELFSDDMGPSKERVYDVLGINRTTATRLKKADAVLATEPAERAVCVAGLIARAQQMMAGTKNTTFDAAAYIGRWLKAAHPALGGKAPEQFLATGVGRQLITRLLSQQASGAYA